MGWSDKTKRREYDRAHYSANRDKRRAQQREYMQTYLKTHRVELRAKAEAWRLANPERYDALVRRSWLKTRYGITPEDYLAMLVAQGGCCAICRTATPGRGAKHFSVDHDHATGEVRGLLCFKCNAALGLLGDNADTARGLIAYLEQK